MCSDVLFSRRPYWQRVAVGALQTPFFFHFLCFWCLIPITHRSFHNSLHTFGIPLSKSFRFSVKRFFSASSLPCCGPLAHVILWIPPSVATFTLIILFGTLFTSTICFFQSSQKKIFSPLSIVEQSAFISKGLCTSSLPSCLLNAYCTCSSSSGRSNWA